MRMLMACGSHDATNYGEVSRHLMPKINAYVESVMYVT